MLKPKRKLRTREQVERWLKATEAKMTVLEVDEVMKVPGKTGDEWALRCWQHLYFVPRKLEDELRYVECGKTYRIWYYGKSRRVIEKLERYEFGQEA